MHRTTKIATKIGASAAIAAVALIAAATAANAATVNPDGTGFVGKGEVQSAFTMNNKSLQDAVNANKEAFTFSTTQTAAQSLSSSASQDATQYATQTAHRVLSCTVTTGGVKNPKVFENDGTRDGSKTGHRDGSRTGSRTGSLDGTLAASIASDPRKTGQWTGWNLTGFTSGPSFTATGDESFGTPTFGDPTFTSDDYAFGEVTWGGWQAAPGENPADCLRNDNGAEITDLSDVTTYGAVVEDPNISYDATIRYGQTQYLAVSPTASAQMFVTYGSGIKPLSIAVPVA